MAYAASQSRTTCPIEVLAPRSMRSHSSSPKALDQRVAVSPSTAAAAPKGPSVLEAVAKLSLGDENGRGGGAFRGDGHREGEQEGHDGHDRQGAARPWCSTGFHANS